MQEAVALPSIKPVDEYHSRYGSVYKESPAKVNSSKEAQIEEQPLFYNPRRSKVVEFSFDNAPDSPSLTDRSMLQSSSSSSDGSTSSSSVAPRPAVRSSISSSLRPKTTERLDKILEKDLKIYGSPGDIKPPTPAPKKIPNQRFFVGQPVSGGDEFGSEISVDQMRESRGRATLLESIKRDVEDVRSSLVDGLKNSGAAAPVAPRRTMAETHKTSKIDDLLNQEQDALSMSLSHSKFLQLKNANIERVKSQEDVADEGEMNLVKMKTKTVDLDKDDEFEKIPRAVTARNENRQRKKKQRQGERVRRDTDTDLAPTAPPHDDPEISRDDEQSVGFLAMLFSGRQLLVLV